MGKLRFWIPNAITSAGIVCAALSIQESIDGHYRTAAWWAMYCLLTDKIDGAAARMLKASSAFGAQMDSFSDFFSFGVAPAVLYYSFYSRTPSLGWTDPAHHVLLLCLVIFHLVCVAGRLARFNVVHDIKGAERFFFGWPTTYIGGMLSAFFVFCLKYGDPALTANDPSDDHIRIFGDLSTTGALAWLPWAMVPGGLTMISKLRLPKVNRTGTRWIDALMLANFLGGYSSGLLRRFPEYLVAGSITYMFIAMRYHWFVEYPKKIKMPPLFPDDTEAAAPHHEEQGRDAHG